MNISGLIRSLIGETQAADPKKLELKVGEVVKGLVLQLLADQEALINIGGVQVRAKLETPLKQGEVTLLQVQPESTQSGQIVLKPLAESGVQIADDSLAEVLKNVSIQDNASNRQMIQTLHQSGIPISKDNVQAFMQFQAQVPTSHQQEELLPSAVVAFQKGLPLTLDTVSAVRQTIAGPAFHETLQQLDSQMNKLLSEDHALSSATRAALDTVKQVVAMIKDSSNQVLPQSEITTEALSSDGEGNTQSAKGTATTAGNSQLTAGKAFTDLSNQGANTAMQTGSALATSDVNNTILKSASPTQVLANAAGAAASTDTADSDPSGSTEKSVQASMVSKQTAQSLGVAASGMTSGQAVTNNDGIGQTPATAITSQGNQSVSNAGGNAGSGSIAEPNNSQTSNAASRAAETALIQSGGNLQESETNEHWLPKMMKALGIEHEHHIGRLPDKMLQDVSGNKELGALSSLNSGIASSEDQQRSSETLKSALMQLMQADDVPPAFKESAQQTIQQITGQQLLLNSDRASMFSHITLFVPLMNANGEQTAAVHIQSRKGARGEIDAHNCRLVFDLRMKSLGDTMVDVQVVDRIVSLRVLNDQPFIQQLLESNRDEISAGLSSIGYQFISIKCGPYPEKGQDSQSTSSEASGNKQENPISSHLQAVYGKKAYKGMDVRV
ncbi:hypothetical protein GC093_09510 [Paenibacillus sp. LMG 31456]|uniref:Flagellar hook-length control protein-like C-terminal domain-containing protein n=1 Tax=Paenibacillus foliorum TaxID=2654974 RepID=A0A972GMI6_9BACL|nr:hypothetical protein [Paenibacillus foliorum]NOU93454.1 hypothetical protein [Paenibacillus foliorum]